MIETPNRQNLRKRLPKLLFHKKLKQPCANAQLSFPLKLGSYECALKLHRWFRHHRQRSRPL